MEQMQSMRRLSACRKGGVKRGDDEWVGGGVFDKDEEGDHV